MKTCNVAGCSSKHYAKGWCRKHYRQVQELGYDEPVPDQKLCKECNEPFTGRPDNEYCSKPCKMKWHRKFGSYSDRACHEKGFCVVEGCGSGQLYNGLCRKHYLRNYRHGDPEGGLPEEAPICSRDDCDDVAGRVSGLCPRHYHNEYYHANHDVERARRNARRTRVKQATPPWVDMAEIREIYLNCPEGHEVDHIEPLLGKDSRGLHVPWNLQYLTTRDNRVKSNKM